jgi:hypothetical protein
MKEYLNHRSHFKHGMLRKFRVKLILGINFSLATSVTYNLSGFPLLTHHLEFNRK